MWLFCRECWSSGWIRDACIYLQLWPREVWCHVHGVTSLGIHSQTRGFARRRGLRGDASSADRLLQRMVVETMRWKRIWVEYLCWILTCGERSWGFILWFPSPPPPPVFPIRGHLVGGCISATLPSQWLSSCGLEAQGRSESHFFKGCARRWVGNTNLLYTSPLVTARKAVRFPRLKEDSGCTDWLCSTGNSCHTSLFVFLKLCAALVMTALP